MNDHTDRKSVFRFIIISMREHKMFNFMCSLVILLVLSAALEDYKYGHFVLSVLSVVVVLAGVYVASANKRSVVIMLILALPWFLSEWFFIIGKTVFVGFFFFIYVIWILFDMIIKTKEITENTLYGTVCIYLLLGLLWASLYGLIDEIIPGAIFYSEYGEHTLTHNELIYFSYTTLTTLGYGDITSVTPVGRIMAVIEAITGQLFIVFMVGRLLSIYLIKSRKDNE